MHVRSLASTDTSLPGTRVASAAEDRPGRRTLPPLIQHPATPSTPRPGSLGRGIHPQPVPLLSCTLPRPARRPFHAQPGPGGVPTARVHQLVGKVVSPNKFLAHAASPGRPSGAATGATENIIRRSEHANYSACYTLQPPRHKLRPDSPLPHPYKIEQIPATACCLRVPLAEAAVVAGCICAYLLPAVSLINATRPSQPAVPYINPLYSPLPSPLSSASARRHNVIRCNVRLATYF